MPKRYPILEALRTACADHRAGNQCIAEALYFALEDSAKYPPEHIRAVVAYIAIHKMIPSAHALDVFIQEARARLSAAYPNAA